MVVLSFVVGIRRAVLAASVMMTIALTSAYAGPLEDAVAASDQGDYVGALDILRPGALLGHPDQHEMWDADSRVGFVIVADKLSEQLWNDAASDEVIKSHEADLVLAFEIASEHAKGEVFVNWGMRYYLGRMYLFGAGVAEDGARGEDLLQQVAESDNERYATLARQELCLDLAVDEYCY